MLVTRQQKTGEFGINLLNPLDEFRVSDEMLEFANLSERYGFVEPESTTYRVSWSLYDNQAATIRQQLRSPATLSDTRAPLPPAEQYRGDRSLLLLAELHSQHPDHPQWDRPISVYLRSNGASYEVVGIERESPEEYVAM